MLPRYIIILEHQKKEKEKKKPKKRKEKLICFIMLAWLGNTSRGCHFPSSNSLRAKKSKTYIRKFQLPR